MNIVFLSVSLSLLLTVIINVYIMSLLQNSYLQVIITVNQLLFARTLFHDLSEMNWFAANNFCDQDLSTPFFKITTLWQILVHSKEY